MELPPNPILTPHRKRLCRADVPGDARFLTFSCFRRQPFLSRPRSCEWVLDALERSRETHGLHLWGFVVMPEHVRRQRLRQVYELVAHRIGHPL